MNNNALYTVIITNYNNTKYLQNALNSVFKQNYKNIQLIITDDGSTEFELKKIKKYIEKNKKNNIKSVDYIINDKNIGTVKTLNKAIKQAKGEYILFFASDDELYDEKVLNNFEKRFIETNYNIITSQWRICDENMNYNYNFVDEKRSEKLNRNIEELKYVMCRSNIYGSGSTSYRKMIFKKYGLFETKYTLLEDWPYWLKLLRNNELIYYANFYGLNHRDGGISKTTNISKKLKIFRNEILMTYTNEILPMINAFPYRKQYNILRGFEHQMYSYADTNDIQKYNEELYKNIKKEKIVRLLWIYNNFFPNIIEKIRMQIKYNKVLIVTIITSICICYILANILNLPKNILFIIYLLTYSITYIINSIVINLLRIKKRVK